MSKKEIKEAVRNLRSIVKISPTLFFYFCVQIKESQLMQKLASDYVVEYIHSFNTHVRGISLGLKFPVVVLIKVQHHLGYHPEAPLV